MATWPAPPCASPTVHLWSPLDVEKTMDLPAPALWGNFNDAVRELQVFHR